MTVSGQFSQRFSINDDHSTPMIIDDSSLIHCFSSGIIDDQRLRRIIIGRMEVEIDNNRLSSMIIGSDDHNQYNDDQRR